MLIGITGRKFSGKDTISEYIVKNYKFTRRAFADPLKLAVKELFILTDEQLYTDKKEAIDERWGLKPREIFQLFGTEIVRETFPKYFPVSNDFWIRNMDLYYKDNKHHNIIISDVRFQNEIDFIEKNNGIVIKAVRSHLDNDDLHQSENIENLVYKSKIVINNNGTVDQLYEKVDKIMNIML